MAKNENNIEKYEPEWTSISVTKSVLRWVSNVKSLMEYIQKRKITNNEALFYICAVADHALASEYGFTKDDFNTFFEKKFKELSAQTSEEELRILYDDMISFGLFRRGAENAEK